ncbi:aminoacyl-tRNA hydrolase [Pelotomaculum propionicicum]|uniref:aminoacyl-tRNA hydrolase n=1 Tax=Pelotomaculum propionicicum TaxID=258475 RepID=UPI003B787113
MKLIAGLGNPGREYAATRHNIGFMVIDRLARRLGLAVEKKKFKALFGQGQISSEKVLLAKPQTYMNLSGEAVAALLRWHKLGPADLLVVYDDMDLPPGKLRIRAEGGSGGHKGMDSIIRALGTEGFPRLRIGVGKPEVPGFDGADFVLSRLTGEDAKTFEESADTAAEAIHCIVSEGLEKAMNEYNRK